jgi:hypothetical protein
VSEKIIQALGKLDQKDDSHWTSDGAPRVDVLSKMVGEELTRAAIVGAAPDFTRATLKLPEPAPSPTAADVADAAAKVAASAPPVVQKVLDQRAQVREAIAALDEEIAAQRAEVEAAQKKLRELEAAQNTLHDGISSEYSHVENQLAIMAAIDRAKETRAQRAGNRAILRQAFTKDELTGKSGLDQALAAKRGFGQNRPAFNPAAPKK